jgi:hypothetical protein
MSTTSNRHVAITRANAYPGDPTISGLDISDAQSVSIRHAPEGWDESCIVTVVLRDGTSVVVRIESGVTIDESGICSIRID